MDKPGDTNVDHDVCRQIVETCQRLPSMPPYEAGLAYREVVRLEGQQIRHLITNPTVLSKYDTYLKRFTLPPPRRYFTDHNYAQKLAPTLDFVRSMKGTSALDAACGNGFEAVLLAMHGKRVVANDISSARVEVAQARAEFYRNLLGPAHFSLSVTCGDATEIKDCFDVIYVQEAISHIHPAETFLREVASRMLTPDGRLIVCDSNGWNPVTRLRMTRHFWAERRTLRHYVQEQVEPETGRKYLIAEERLFSPVGIRRAFRAAGLEVERLVMSGFTVPQIVRQSGDPLGRLIDRTLPRVPVVREFGGFYTAIGRRRAA